jgi:F-type H+-transporting ATPase subunit gamma
VTSIQKITRAMEMVATTRLRRTQARAEGGRPYADALQAFSALLAGGGVELSSPLTRPRDKVKSVAILHIGSDRGLCGPFNANLQRKTVAFLGERPGVEPRLHVLGRKPRLYFAKRLPMAVAYDDPVEKLSFRRAREIARELTGLFLKGGDGGGGDEVWIVSMRFVSVGRQVPTVDRLLPITAGDAKGAAASSVGGAVAAGKASSAAPQILLEPSPQELFDALMPKSVDIRVWAAMLDSMASEQAARRMAMKAATDAAGEMIQSLTRKYNRARQEAITKELLDIVGGAEALA